MHITRCILVECPKRGDGQDWDGSHLLELLLKRHPYRRSRPPRLLASTSRPRVRGHLDRTQDPVQMAANRCDSSGVVLTRRKIGVKRLRSARNRSTARRSSNRRGSPRSKSIACTRWRSKTFTAGRHSEFPIAREAALLSWRASALRRFCCKSRKSNYPKNLAKVDLGLALLLHRLSAPLRRPVIDFA